MMYLWIAVGSALGGMARYFSSGIIAEKIGERFPWDTLIVNALGSLVIGFLAGLSAPDGRYLISSKMRVFLMVGVCGGYTTFSTFSLQTLNLLHEGQFIYAALKLIILLILCLICVWIGYILANLINQLKGY